MTRAYTSVLSNPREARTVLRLQQAFMASEPRRKRAQQELGVDVPPFLIASIATTCNLSCAGCYARANGIAADEGQGRRQVMKPEEWRAVFEEAAKLGINFALLAGGEPLTRRDILQQVAEVKDMIFPIFTNGTMFSPWYLDFFAKNLNLIPVISVEGNRVTTDERRGEGVYQRALKAMDCLHEANLFYGVSLTVTTENFAQITSDEYVDSLRERGCKLVIYVEYVPTDEGTEHLALSPADSELMEQAQERLMQRYDNMVVISFPGGEKKMGGCLAAGRGFFHIGPDGAAEPCPFSPYSDASVRTIGIAGALKSPLFRKLRDSRLVGGEHDGGCVLWEHRAEVEAMLNEPATTEA